MKNHGDLYKEIVRLTLPITFQQFMVALVGASDAVMLGRLEQDAMSAVSLATQVTFAFHLFMTGLTVGENMFMAQFYGKKDYADISKIFSLTFRSACIVAAVFWMGTLIFPENIMAFFTNESGLADAGSQYLKLIGSSYLFSAISQICMTVMKNCGAVKMSTVIGSATVALNILLNAVFIFGTPGIPAMGISGAAAATVAATAVQTVWSLIYIKRKMKYVEVRLLQRFSGLEKQFWGKTAPALLNEVVWGIGFTMYAVILGHLGSDAVAANSIANISKNLLICLCLGLGNAGSIIVGNRLGANLFEEAKQAGRVLVKISVLCGALSGGILVALFPAAVRLAELTPAAQDYLKSMFLVCFYYLIGKSVNCMTIGGIFPAGGDSRFGLVCDTVTEWCVIVPLGFLCAFVWNLPVAAVYFVLSLDEIVKLPVVYRNYKKYRWLHNLTDTDMQNKNKKYA